MVGNRIHAAHSRWGFGIAWNASPEPPTNLTPRVPAGGMVDQPPRWSTSEAGSQHRCRRSARTDGCMGG